MKDISIDDLIPFDLFEDSEPVLVDPVYADSAHPENVFGRLYRPETLLLGHIDMVVLVLYAAQILNKTRGWKLVIKDCLRPIEAQQKMMDTSVVRANPQWLEEPRFLSPPGLGGHPRGMAVDLAAIGPDGKNLDFGTSFDCFAKSPLPQHNRAHRHHPDLPEFVRQNRTILDDAMKQAAQKTGQELVLLSTEWWDFRFPASYTSEFTPISDSQLKGWQKMVGERDGDIPSEEADLIRSRVFDRLNELGDSERVF